MLLSLLLVLPASTASAACVTEFSKGITAGTVETPLGPAEITRGPDGNLWFTESDANKVGRITPAGVVTEFSAGISPSAGLTGITVGPDGNLWFTEPAANKVGRITPAGVVTEFSAGISPTAGLSGIAAGPDGNLWFTESAGNRVSRVTPAGIVTEFSSGISGDASPATIASGPGGTLWFAEPGVDQIAQLTPSGVVTEFGGIGGSPKSIATDPDGNLWVTEDVATNPYDHVVQDDLVIGKVTPGSSCPPAKIVTRRATVSRTGRLKLVLACVQVADRCSGMLTLTTGVRGRSIRIAEVQYSITPGQTAEVPLLLTRRGRQLLRTAKDHRLNVRATSGSAPRKVTLVLA